MDASCRNGRRFVAWLPLIAGLIPCAAALGFRLAPIGPANVADTEPRAALAFEQRLVDDRFRSLASQPYLRAAFRYHNVSTTSVRITGVETSCGCVTADYTNTEIAPGESGAITVQVNLVNQDPGPQEHFVKLNYLDEKPRQVDLYYRLCVPDQHVTVRPKALVFYQLGSDSTEQTLAITDLRTKRRLNVVEIQSTTDLVTAEVSGRDTVESAQRIHIKVKVAGRVPPGRSRSLVNIVTDDPDYRVLQVPLLIEGPPAQNEVVRTEPGQLLLSRDGTEELRGRIQFEADDGATVSRVTSQPDVLQASATIIHDDHGSRLSVAASASADQVGDFERAVITVETVGRDSAVIQIPVAIEQP